MGKHAPGSYGFTTTETDDYVRRVGREAKSRDNFLVTKEKRPNSAALTLLVREAAIPVKKAGFALGGAPLSKKWGKKIRGTEFRALTLPVEHNTLAKQANIAKDAIQRVKNFNAGRVVKVVVEAL